MDRSQRGSEASGARFESGRILSHSEWMKMLTNALKPKDKQSKPQKVKDFIQFVNKQSGLNFCMAATGVLQWDFLSMDDASILVEYGLIDVYISRILSAMKEAESPEAELDAVWALNGIWVILEGQIPEVGWRELKFRRFAEAIVARPMFWDAVGLMLVGPYWHGVFLAVFCALFAVKSCRLGRCLNFWQQWMPKIAHLQTLYTPQLLIDEAERSPILRLLHPHSGGEKLPPINIIHLRWSASMLDTNYAVVLFMNQFTEEDNHEGFIAAMTPEWIASRRHILSLPLGESIHYFQFACQCAYEMQYLFNRPRYLEDDDPRYLARLDRLFELFPDLFDVMLKLGQSISDYNWWIKFENMIKNSHTYYSSINPQMMLNLIAMIMYSLSTLANVMSKTRHAPKLLPAVQWLAKAVQLVKPETVYPKGNERILEKMQSVFAASYCRELDADRVPIEGQPGTRTILLKSPVDQQFRMAVTRLQRRFPKETKDLGEDEIITPINWFMGSNLVDHFKEIGNQFFKQGDYWSAIFSYRDSCEYNRLLRQSAAAMQIPTMMGLPLPMPMVDGAEKLIELEATCYSNMAQCFLNLGKPDHALKQCEVSLKVRPRHEKTMQRMQLALTRIAEAKEKGESKPTSQVKLLEVPPFPEFTPGVAEDASTDKGSKKRQRRRRKHQKAADSASSSSSSSAAQNQDDSSSEDDAGCPECIVCFEEQTVPFGITPCGHGPLCSVCVGFIKECPMCRKAIKGRQKKSPSAAKSFKFFF